MEFEKLASKIDEFNKLSNNTSSENLDKLNLILNNKVPIVKKENYRGNQYELDQFNWELQKKEYYARIRKEKLGRTEKETTEVESVDKLQNMLEKDQYNKKWNKLDLYCKKQKFKEYINDLRNSSLIEEGEEKLYLNYLFKMLTKKVLTKSSEVDYDIQRQKITNIPILDKKIKALSA